MAMASFGLSSGSMTSTPECHLERPAALRHQDAGADLAAQVAGRVEQADIFVDALVGAFADHEGQAMANLASRKSSIGAPSAATIEIAPSFCHRP